MCGYSRRAQVSVAGFQGQTRAWALKSPHLCSPRFSSFLVKWVWSWLHRVPVSQCGDRVVVDALTALSLSSPLRSGPPPSPGGFLLGWL